MIFNSQELLNDLTARINNNIVRCEKLITFPLAALNKKENATSWSALECIEHLNLYDDFYIPEITKRISENKTTSTLHFKSGWLGNYFAISMLPKKNGIQKMKTFKDKNPINSNLNINSIDKFIQNQQAMLVLIDKAKSVNLKKVKTNISISSMIKLRLGDTLRFITYHYERHLNQAEKATNI
jgi:hypothetical protein